MTFRATVWATAGAVLIGGWAWAQSDDAQAKLGEAAKKASEWKSYKFHVDSKVEGGGGKNAGGPVDGTFEKDKGVHVKGDKFEAVKAGDKTAVAGKDGLWTLAGDAKDPAGDKKGKQGAAQAEPPHSGFAGLEKKFSKVESAADGENTVYSGDLTSTGAADLMGALIKRLAKNGDVKGTAKVTVNKDGQIVKIEINGTAAGKLKDQDVTLTVQRVVTFSDVDAATLTIPDGAKKVLEQP